MVTFNLIIGIKKGAVKKLAPQSIGWNLKKQDSTLSFYMASFSYFKYKFEYKKHNHWLSGSCFLFMLPFSPLSVSSDDTYAG